MQKHHASYALARMEQKADVSGSAYVTVKPMDDGEPRRLVVYHTGPARYRYVSAYCGRDYASNVSNPPRVAISCELERRHALDLLADIDGTNITFTGVHARIA